jgi:hypothetical protein
VPAARSLIIELRLIARLLLGTLGVPHRRRARLLRDGCA